MKKNRNAMQLSAVLLMYNNHVSLTVNPVKSDLFIFFNNFLKFKHDLY